MSTEEEIDQLRENTLCDKGLQFKDPAMDEMHIWESFSQK